MLEMPSAVTAETTGEREPFDPWSNVRCVGAVEAVRMGMLARLTGDWPVLACDGTELRVSAHASRPSGGEAIHVDAAFGSHGVEGFLPLDLVQAFVRNVGAAQNCGLLPPEMLAVVIEHFVAPHVAFLEGVLGGPFRVNRAVPKIEITPDADLTLKIEGLGETPTSVVVRLSDDSLTHLTSKVRCDGTCKGHLWIRLSFMGSPFLVPGPDLCRLRVGNGFLMPEDFNPARIAALIVGDRYVLPVTQTEEGLVVRDPNNPPDFEDDELDLENRAEEEYGEEYDDARTQLTNDESPSTADGIERFGRWSPDVEVAVQLACKRVSLIELQDYVEGQVIPMPGELGTEAHLTVDGRRIARIELLRVDEGFGVRIVELL